MKRPRLPWPPERVAQFRRLLLRFALTDAEIAEQMGLTLRAVQGKRQRMGLEPNPRKRGRKLGGRNAPKSPFVDGSSRVDPVSEQLKRATTIWPPGHAAYIQRAGRTPR